MSTRRIRLAATVTAVAVLLGCAGDPVQGGAPPEAAPTSSASTPPAGPVEWVDGLPVGRPPEVGYVVGHTYHSPEGGMVRLRLDRRAVTSIAQLGDGFLVTDDRYFEGTMGLARLSATGTIDPSLTRPGHEPGFGTVASPPVVSADGSSLHWLTFTPPETGVIDPTLIHSADVGTGVVTTVEVDVSPAFLTSLIGVVGDDVLFRTGWVGHGETWVRSGSAPARRAPALDGAAMIHARSRLVTAFLGKRGKVAAVLGYGTREVLWHARGTSLLSFSPSGDRLLAWTRDGFVVVDGRTGTVRSRIGETTVGIRSWELAAAAWEDEHHLLVTVERGGRASIVRGDVRTDRWEVAVDWSHTDGGPVTFETRP